MPLLCGASLHGLGVEPLLDALVHYLPAPHERPQPIVRAPRRPTAAAAASTAATAATSSGRGARKGPLGGGAGGGGAAGGGGTGGGELSAELSEVALEEAAAGVAFAFKVVHEGRAP